MRKNESKIKKRGDQLLVHIHSPCCGCNLLIALEFKPLHVEKQTKFLSRLSCLAHGSAVWNKRQLSFADIQMGNNYWREVLAKRKRKRKRKRQHWNRPIFSAHYTAYIAYIISKFTMFNRIYSLYPQPHTRAPTAKGIFEKPHNLM